MIEPTIILAEICNLTTATLQSDQRSLQQSKVLSSCA